jgi:acyl-coenzyme A synthetase/AMP-(fatty) acid ligase
LENHTIDPKSIFDLCKKELPANYVPAYLHVLGELPKTLTEKPLTRELKQLADQGVGKMYKSEDCK